MSPWKHQLMKVKADISHVRLIYIELFLLPWYVEKSIAEISLAFQRQTILLSSFLIIFCYQGKGGLAWAKYKASWEPLNINFGVSLKTNLGLKRSGDLMTSPVVQCVSYFSLFTFVIKSALVLFPHTSDSQWSFVVLCDDSEFFFNNLMTATILSFLEEREKKMSVLSLPLDLISIIDFPYRILLLTPQ